MGETHSQCLSWGRPGKGGRLHCRWEEICTANESFGELSGPSPRSAVVTSHSLSDVPQPSQGRENNGATANQTLAATT